MKTLKTFAFLLFIIGFSNCESEEVLYQEAESVQDIDGNVYKTVKIGNQVWMAENLKTTRFNDGTPITKYSFDVNGNNWLNLNTPEAFYQWADTSDLNDVYDMELPEDFYGAMYNHVALESGKLAPEGYRLPTAKDFRELELFLAKNGFENSQAIALKSEEGWISTIGNGINAVGFNALPNGYVHALGGATFAEGITTLATTSVNAATKRRLMINLSVQYNMLVVSNAIQIGAGVRCIKE